MYESIAQQDALSPLNIGLPQGQNIGLLKVLPTSGRLMVPEMVIALSAQMDPTHMTSGYLCIKGAPIDKARELAAEKALEAKAKYLWFVDDDTVPPPNAVKRLIYVLDNYPDVMVCGGIYVTRDPDVPQPLVFRGMGNGSYWRWKVGDVFEVTGMGAGCMMINCEIFKKIPKPWFPWPTSDSTDPKIPSTSVSEDISFCNAVQEAGYKVFAHGGVLCDHWDAATGKVYRLPSDSYPMRPREVEQVSAVTPQESQKE